MLFNSGRFGNLSNNHSSANQASWEAKYRFILQLIWVTPRRQIFRGLIQETRILHWKANEKNISKQRCSRCNKEEPTSSKSITMPAAKSYATKKHLRKISKREFAGSPQQQDSSTWVTTKESSQRLLSSNAISLSSQPWQLQPSPIPTHFPCPRGAGLCTITDQVFLTSASFMHNRKWSCGSLFTVFSRGIWTPQNNRL